MLTLQSCWRRVVMPNRTKPAQCTRLTVIAVMLCVLPTAAFSQDYYVIPTLTIKTLYDDNVLLNPETQEQSSDIFMRVSPQLDIGYDSDQLDWLLSYRNDSEWYRDLSFLDNTSARGFGRADINYVANRRLSINGFADYIHTNSAEDITLIPGEDIPGRLGRADANRFGLGGGIDYEFTQNFQGKLFLRWVDDELEDVSESETRTALAQLDQRLSRNRKLLYGFRYQDFDIDRRINTDPIEIVNTTASSQTPWVGLSQKFNETNSLDLRAGPRFSESTFFDTEVNPYFLIRWNRQYDRGNTSLSATWDETTVVAETGPVETKAIRANWGHQFTEKIDVNTTVSYADVDGTGYKANNAALGLIGNYRVNPYIFISARYRFVVQDVDRSLELRERRITRNIVSVAITFTRPRPGTGALF